MRSDERDDRYPEGGVTREQTVESIARALFARHQGTTWDRGIAEYRDQAEYLLTHADAQDREHAHFRPSYLAPVGTPPRKPRAAINPKLNEAVQWLTAALAEGPQDSKQLRRAAYEEENISGATLRRARAVIGIKPKLRRGAWIWELPATEGKVEARDFGIAEPEVLTLPVVSAPAVESKPAPIKITSSTSDEEIREIFRQHQVK